MTNFWLDFHSHRSQFKNKLAKFNCMLTLASEGGPDGTRTRDPMRDRHVF
jgi:hypothetical protein